MTEEHEVPAAPPAHSGLSRVADASALGTVAIGLLVIAGWLLEIDPLKRVLPGLVAMKFNTALGLLLAGAGLWWRGRPAPRTALGTVVAVLGALSLGEHAAGLDVGIDQLFVRDLAGSSEAAYVPGLMAPSSALCFLLLGLALMGSGGSRRGARRLSFAAELLALAATVTGGFSLLAYPTGAVYLRQVPGSVSMALPTAVGFVLLGTGVLCAAEGVVIETLRLRGTGRVLWTGFGVLTCLLVTIGVVYALNTQTLAQDLDAQANVARPRREATLELENRALGYGLAVRSALAGDSQGRRTAVDHAINLARHLAEYRALATTDRERELAEQFAARWRDVHTLGTALLEAGAQAGDEELARFATLRARLVDLIEKEMQPEAVEAFEARQATTLRDLRRTGDSPLLLLVVCVLLALLTSGAVARVVAKQEQALRLSNARLQEADQRKNEFLAVLSHELRNPLTPIRNSVYVLERATPGSEQAKRAVQVIDRQTEQLARLVDDLLEVTRITRNRIQLQRGRLELNDVVRRSVEDYRSLFEARGVVLETQCAPEQLPINGDAARLAQVVGNLLHNAAKFTPTGGRVLVSTSAATSPGRATLRVIDTGVGIAPAVLGRLFEPFMQADATLDRSKGGLGLGLTLVKGIVEMHGGEVSAHSAGCGKGAELVVELPLDRTSAGSVKPAQPMATHSRRRILIIEDNLDAASSLSEALRLEAHEVVVAHSGAEGLATAREFRPEVVLCDIGLPGMDGYAVARAFRADGDLRGAHLVALSGYAQPDDLQRATEAGFERHLAKPPSLDKLEELLASLPAAGGGDRGSSGVNERGNSGAVA